MKAAAAVQMDAKEKVDIVLIMKKKDELPTQTSNIEQFRNNLHYYKKTTKHVSTKKKRNIYMWQLFFGIIAHN